MFLHEEYRIHSIFDVKLIKSVKTSPVLLFLTAFILSRFNTSPPYCN